MPLIKRKTAIHAAPEVTYGLSPTLVATDAILVKSVNLKPMAVKNAERTLVRPYFGKYQQLLGTVNAEIEIEIELAGSGTAGTAPAYGKLLKACSMSETISAGVSVTYAPSSASTDSVTIQCNIDGVNHKLTGCRGTLSAPAKVGDIWCMKMNFTGIYNAVTDAVQLGTTLTAWKQPLAVNNTNTTCVIHGISAPMSELSFDLANNVVYRSLVNGAQAVLITDRSTAGKIVIEATTVATKDWWATIIAATLGNLALTHGTVAGNRVAINATGTLQLSEPDYSDMDGVLMMGANLSFVPVAGNDEFSIVVS